MVAVAVVEPLPLPKSLIKTHGLRRSSLHPAGGRTVVIDSVGSFRSGRVAADECSELNAFVEEVPVELRAKLTAISAWMHSTLKGSSRERSPRRW